MASNKLKVKSPRKAGPAPIGVSAHKSEASTTFEASREEGPLISPSEVRIFGKSFAVRRMLESGGFSDYGQTDIENLEILLREGLLPVEEMDTLLHETLHAVDFLFDLELTERQVKVLATAIIGILQDNPSFKRFISQQVT